MTALRIFPFIGALIAIAAVVLTIIGISTTYWFATDLKTHSGK
jgi:choline-glycine betaine transporter